MYFQPVCVVVPPRTQMGFSNKAEASFGVSLLGSIPRWTMTLYVAQKERRWRGSSPGADQHE